MAILHVESSFNPQADNGVGYVGLIQFSAGAAKSVGTTQGELKKMNFITQMDYVEKYLVKKKNELNTLTDLYLMVLKPNAVGKGTNPDYILFDESIEVPNVPYNKENLYKEPWVTKYGYTSNPTYMKEPNEKVIRKHQTYSKGEQNRYGFIGGKTYIWEVTQVLKEEHYNPGMSQKYIDECKNIKKEKKKKDSKKAPWMKLAWKEEAKKLVETGSNKEIQKFFDGTPYEKSMKNGTTNESIYWCGAFVNWIMTQYGYNGLGGNSDPYDSVRALKWVEWKEGEKLDKPVYGAIAVKKRKGGGHVGFVAGKKGDKIIILGGNQGNSLKCSTYNITDYFAYIAPKDYIVEEEDYNLPEYEGNPSSNDSET